MDTVHEVNTEPIPGYRLLEPLGRGGVGEVWKCQAPGGLKKAIKFVPNGKERLGGHDGVAQELRALEYLRALRHSFLLNIERVEMLDGELAIITELADRSLHDLLQQYRRSGRVGVPRAEVLDYLQEAAEVLDVLNQEHQLQHLDIKPRNLFLIGRHVKVADFGLLASLADILSRAGNLGGITPLYASPEIFAGKVSLFSDQYSLAVAYHELVTGEHPLRANNYAHLAMLVTTQEPDLHKLPEADRPIVARALSKDPAHRFNSCSAFIEQLQAVSLPCSSTSSNSRATWHGSGRKTAFEFDLGSWPNVDLGDATSLEEVAKTKIESRVRGTTVAYLLTLGHFSDFNKTTPQGIAVVRSTANNEGRWLYSGDHGMTWHSLGEVYHGRARLLGRSDLVRFVAHDGYRGTATLTFRAWDGTANNKGETVNLATASSYGPKTPFSKEVTTAEWFA
jgi:serine/threonine protein kinase